MQPNRNRAGFTLMELMIVLVILVILAGIVVPLISSSTEDTKIITTRASMKALRDAILTYRQDMKGVDAGVGPMRTGIPWTLKDLQVCPKDSLGIDVPPFDPVTRHGWRGPYLMQATGRFDPANHDTSFNSYGMANDDPVFMDGWGNPIVLQWPTVGSTFEERAKYVRLVSAGAPTKYDSVKHAFIGELTIPANALMPLIATRGNDEVLFVLTQDIP